MMRVPAAAAINAAEARVFNSKRSVRQSLDRSRTVIRSALAQPTTLVVVAVASGILGFLASHRPRPSVKRQPKSAGSTKGAFSRSLVQTVVSTYGARALSFALQRGANTQKQTASAANGGMHNA